MLDLQARCFFRLNEALNRHPEMNRLYEDGAIPVVGTLASTLGVVYATARLIQYCVKYLFKGIQYIGSGMDCARRECNKMRIKAELKQLEIDITDYTFHALTHAAGAATLGFFTGWLMDTSED